MIENQLYCKCGCGSGPKEMNKNFLMKLRLVEEISGIKLNFSSGMRCRKHNSLTPGASSTSSHPKGCAADIIILNSRERFLILRSVVAVGFKRFGIRKDFIHVDDDSDKAQEVTWIY